MGSRVKSVVLFLWSALNLIAPPKAPWGSKKIKNKCFKSLEKVEQKSL